MYKKLIQAYLRARLATTAVKTGDRSFGLVVATKAGNLAFVCTTIIEVWGGILEAAGKLDKAGFKPPKGHFTGQLEVRPHN